MTRKKLFQKVSFFINHIIEDFFFNCWYHTCRSRTANVHTLIKAFSPEWQPVQDARQWNCIPCLRRYTLKTIPCWAAHTPLGQIRECPPPKGVNHQRISLWFNSDFPEISFRLAYRKRQNSLGALSLREQPACLCVRVDPLLNKTRERYLLTSHALCCRCIKILQSSTCEIRGPGNFSARIYISKSKSVIRWRSF